ncbi:MAG: hypothetical protein ABI693_13240 [Bryobacteraceae bacterium]
MKQAITAFVLTFGLTLPAPAQDPPDKTANLVVSAKMDVWRAGGYNDGSDGVSPAKFDFVAGKNHFITFPIVTGSWSCGAGALYSADGTNAGADCNGPRHIVDPIGGVSGFDSTDFYGALTGLFLDDTPTTTPAPPLRFYVTNNTMGGFPTGIREFHPRLGQVFFIGDGLTGTGTGDYQRFWVPPAATHLYLGYVDAYPGPNPLPNGYSNNVGGLTVFLRLHTRIPSNPCDLPPAYGL